LIWLAPRWLAPKAQTYAGTGTVHMIGLLLALRDGRHFDGQPKHPGTCQMNEPKKSRRDWRLVLVAILVAAVLVVGIVYKYTGDLTGIATFGTSGRTSSPQ
jgi:hypothetical protein